MEKKENLNVNEQEGKENKDLTTPYINENEGRKAVIIPNLYDPEISKQYIEWKLEELYKQSAEGRKQQILQNHHDCNCNHCNLDEDYSIKLPSYLMSQYQQRRDNFMDAILNNNKKIQDSIVQDIKGNMLLIGDHIIDKARAIHLVISKIIQPNHIIATDEEKEYEYKDTTQEIYKKYINVHKKVSPLPYPNGFDNYGIKYFDIVVKDENGDEKYPTIFCRSNAEELLLKKTLYNEIQEAYLFEEVHGKKIISFDIERIADEYYKEANKLPNSITMYAPIEYTLMYVAMDKDFNVVDKLYPTVAQTGMDKLIYNPYNKPQNPLMYQPQQPTYNPNNPFVTPIQPYGMTFNPTPFIPQYPHPIIPYEPKMRPIKGDPKSGIINELEPDKDSYKVNDKGNIIRTQELGQKKTPIEFGISKDPREMDKQLKISFDILPGEQKDEFIDTNGLIWRCNTIYENGEKNYNIVGHMDNDTGEAIYHTQDKGIIQTINEMEKKESEILNHDYNNLIKENYIAEKDIKNLKEKENISILENLYELDNNMDKYLSDSDKTNEILEHILLEDFDLIAFNKIWETKEILQKDYTDIYEILNQLSDKEKNDYILRFNKIINKKTILSFLESVVQELQDIEDMLNELEV